METRRPRGQNHSRYLAGGGSVVVALLLCLGVLLLPLGATGSEVPSALSMANVPSLDQERNGSGQPLDGIYLLAPAEEAEDAEKDPLNAKLLRMLVLTVCFGLSLGWLLRGAQRQGALCSLAVVGSKLATSCEEQPFLGVFRL
jgi:hypothetical protein